MSNIVKCRARLIKMKFSRVLPNVDNRSNVTEITSPKIHSLYPSQNTHHNICVTHCVTSKGIVDTGQYLQWQHCWKLWPHDSEWIPLASIVNLSEGGIDLNFGRRSVETDGDGIQDETKTTSFNCVCELRFTRSVIFTLLVSSRTLDNLFVLWPLWLFLSFFFTENGSFCKLKTIQWIM